MKKAIFFGAIGGVGLLGFYFAILTAISGWRFASVQFAETWVWIIALAAGFGVQIGLYTYIRELHRTASGKVVAVSGATSTTAMIACCSHYAVNILPFLGATGLVMFVAQYQTELFFVGMLSNVLGIFYLLRKSGLLTIEYVKTS